ncbi:hypothetical protein [Legionella feeleii]|uniref:Apolipoprotein A1/A4/E domain n=1 Tax=Legionella feeleii TaxID=453 RepID=A0A0W0TI42_9GAMM|nr:hypothetical protein [Legionella feeleii]KTC95268.1 hypothetical protein Lfee_2932 [Legionella feeleii]SPX59687.1 Uncharacterised protein [Legionella feeleii]STX38315.1 Uncharacterised protein [Legionella feeleii]
MKKKSKLIFSLMFSTVLPLSTYAASVDSSAQQIQQLNTQIQGQLKQIQAQQQQQIDKLNGQLQVQMKQMQAQLQQQIQKVNAQTQAQMQKMQAQLQEQIRQVQQQTIKGT